MKRKIRTRITLIVGLILLISNLLLVSLLLLNFNMALNGFQVPINGELVTYYFSDNMEAYLFLAGVVVAILATVVGTVIIHLVLGKILLPLQKLSEHMQKSDRGNLLSYFESDTKIKEVDILISSFNSMNEKLRNIFENQEHFSSSVAHEFRTPLAIILTNLDVYKKQPDMDTDIVINVITEQVKKLSKLVTQILQLVSITRIELKELIPINLIIDEVIEDLEGYANEKEVSIEFNNSLDEGEDIKTVGSHDLLYQAFFNLVENAIKYNKEKGKVFINVTQDEDNIFINIKDTGKGISKEDREKIFEPFYRGDKDRNSKINGNGIGLAFTKQVLNHHQSSIKLCDSDIGASFEIIMLTYDNIIKKGIL